VCSCAMCLFMCHVCVHMCHVDEYRTDVYNHALQVSREVGGREKELTHQVHREILVRCLEQVKTLAPIPICSMKIFIHIIAQGL
jgi:hypothetical protein